MRGSGESEGVLRGEYLKQEQDDALEVLKWIAAQDWCTGSIGMIGISWGGFNGLQVAARRPPELKAVVSICSTDDRYEDDIHYQGGALLVDNFLWGATMFGMNPLPPDPALVGDKWRDLWLQRLEAGGLFMVDWHQHQRRDEFWKHASICEDYSSIQCPVYLVGGWMDPYSNTIFRMLQNLKCPRKGLIGPWAHKYPNFAEPGPQIGFLQETVRWWDKWLKGIDETTIMDEPILRCYLQDPAPPKTHYDFRPGHWVAESSWPSPNVTSQPLALARGRLTDAASSKLTLSDDDNEGERFLSICSPQTVGLASGRWCVFGLDADEPGDQRQEAGGSLVFDSKPLPQPLDLLGPVILKARLASDKPNAVLVAVLSEVLPDGSATRISWSPLNLTHRNGSHEDLEPLEPGRFYDITLKMNELGQRIGVGSRIRLALSTAYFPMIWPSPEVTTLTIDTAHSTLDLPTRRASPLDAQLKPFQPPANSSPLKTRIFRPSRSSNKVVQDLNTGEVTTHLEEDAGLWENEATNWRYGSDQTIIATIHPNDPLSARVKQSFKKEFGREGLDLAVEGWANMTASRTEFHITAHLEAWEQKKQIFARDYAFHIPRDGV